MYVCNSVFINGEGAVIFFSIIPFQLIYIFSKPSYKIVSVQQDQLGSSFVTRLIVLGDGSTFRQISSYLDSITLESYSKGEKESPKYNKYKGSLSITEGSFLILQPVIPWN